MNKRYYFLIITIILLTFLSCSNMAVKDFKPDTYFSRKVDLEMAMADAIYYGNKKLVRDYWKSHTTLTLLAKQDCPLWLQYD